MAPMLQDHIPSGRSGWSGAARRWGGWLLLLTAWTWAGAAEFTIDAAERQVRAAYPNISRLPDRLPDGVEAHENLCYAVIEGHALALDVYQPAARPPAPAVLLVHGGGWETGSREMERPFAKRLAGLGYVAVTVSYRLGPPGRFPAALHDLKAAVRWLRRHAADYGIDPAHIGAIGASAGGQLVALLGASNGVEALEGAVGESGPASTVQAVVDIDGLADFTSPEFIDLQAALPGGPARFLGGSYAERAVVWQLASPLAHVGPQSAPTLFLNSSSSQSVLPGRGEMRDRLKALGIDSRVLVLPDTPHPFWLFEPWFTTVLRETDLFLRRHLVARG